MTPLPIEFITNEDILNEWEITGINGWFPSEDPFSGVINWNSEENPDLSLAATPNWLKQGEVPFELYNSQGELVEIEGWASNPNEVSQFGTLKLPYGISTNGTEFGKSHQLMVYGGKIAAITTYLS